MLIKPEFDRGPSNPKNVFVVVLSRNYDLYTCGCKEGILSTKFTAADLDSVPEKLLDINEVPERTLPLYLRTAI